jgi:hypothetical protein
MYTVYNRSLTQQTLFSTLRPQQRCFAQSKDMGSFSDIIDYLLLSLYCTQECVKYLKRISLRAAGCHGLPVLATHVTDGHASLPATIEGHRSTIHSLKQQTTP